MKDKSFEIIPPGVSIQFMTAFHAKYSPLHKTQLMGDLWFTWITRLFQLHFPERLKPLKMKTCLLFKVEKLVGSTVDKTVIEFIEMPLETKQGFMEFSGIQNGLWHSEHWRVVHINKDYIIGV